MSLSAPAGTVSRNIGSVVAICTADTTIGSGLRLVISQADRGVEHRDADFGDGARDDHDGESAAAEHAPMLDRALRGGSAMGKGFGRSKEGLRLLAGRGQAKGTWRTNPPISSRPETFRMSVAP